MIGITLIFTVIALLFIAGGFIWTWATFGSLSKAKAHWKTKKLFPDMAPILFIPALIMGLAVLLSSNAKAEEIEFSTFNYIQVHAGLEFQLGEPQFVQCVESKTALDEAGSNLGGQINLIRFENAQHELDVNFSYTHHSCAFETDKDVADQVGLLMVWRFNFNGEKP